MMAIKPVPPSIKDELNYSRQLIGLTRVTIQAPLSRAILEAQSVDQVLAASTELANVVGSIDALGADIASAEFSGIAGRHTTKFARSMAGKIPDLALKLSDQTVSAWLSGKVELNVKLIKGLTGDQFDVFNTKINKLFTGGEFDRQALAKAAKDAFGVGDSRAKLIGRDQVSKATGELNSIRQKEVGVEKYRWLTSGDLRVRPSHVENNGKVFEWGSPPATGHPGEDIQCRCVAIPIID